MDNATLVSSVGLWLGFLLSLAAFSAILGDHLLARLAGHLLVGSALGYLLVLVVQNILRPQLIDPLLAGGAERIAALGPLLLSVLLLGGGAATLFRNSEIQGGSGSETEWARFVRRLALLPILLLLGVGLAVAAVGAVQGTLVPLIQQTAAWRGENVALGLFMLLITTGVLMHLFVGTETGTGEQTLLLGRRVLPRFLLAWSGLGQRALWLATGFLFARLVAARLSLLIARFEYFYQALQKTPLGQAISAFWTGG